MVLALRIRLKSTSRRRGGADNRRAFPRYGCAAIPSRARLAARCAMALYVTGIRLPDTNQAPEKFSCLLFRSKSNERASRFCFCSVGCQVELHCHRTSHAFLHVDILQRLLPDANGGFGMSVKVSSPSPSSLRIAPVQEIVSNFPLG